MLLTPKIFYKKSYFVTALIAVILLLSAKEVFSFLLSLSTTLSLSSQKTKEMISSLKEQNLLLSLKLQRFKEISEENKRLRRALNLIKEKNIKIVAAKVVSFSPSLWESYLFINKGLKDGVSKNLYVVDENGYFIGKVISAQEHNAKIIALNNPNFLAVAYTGSHSGMLRGSLSQRIILSYIESRAPAKEGDKVYVKPPYLSNIKFPAGVIFGVKKEKRGFFLKIEVLPKARLNNIKEVFIIEK